MGTNLLHGIFAILLNSDCITQPSSAISQAFLQLALDEKDRDLPRFVLYRITQDSEEHYHTTEEFTTFRFTRLPFGLTCRPFLLSKTLRKHADKHKVTFPTAAPFRDTFVDDLAAGAENDNGALTIYYELSALMKLINVALAKWASNSEQLKTIWRAERQKIEVQTPVLGVNWTTETDCPSTDYEEITKMVPEAPTTERQLL
jgi:hypothetical protein